MRKRRLVSIFVILGLALAGSRMALHAQQPKALPFEIRENSQRGWKSPADPQVKTAQAAPASSPIPIVGAQERAAEPAPEDPMFAVESFLERNRKEANDAIRTLNEEAETLRTRLQKVEAALGRWQAVAGALDLDAKPAQPNPTPPPTTQLEAIPSPNDPGPSAIEARSAPPTETPPTAETITPKLPTITPESVPTPEIPLPSQSLPPSTPQSN